MTSISTATTTATTARLRNSQHIQSILNNLIAPNKLMTLTIGTLTLVAISSLFCLFFVVSILDDAVQIISPALTKKRIDWTGFIDRISRQLTNFAEWEKQKRASWYSEDHPIYHEDRFHDIINAVTTYMNDYVQHRKQRE